MLFSPSSSAMTNFSQKELTIYLYLMQQWKFVGIHTAQQTHCILQNTPWTPAGLTQLEAAHQEGLLFATILSSCMCEWQGSCCSFTLILFIKLFALCGLHVCCSSQRIQRNVNFSIQTNKHGFVHAQTLFPSLCDTEPLRLLNLAAFLHIHTTEGETLQPFCSVLMTGLWALSWLSCPPS